MTDKVAQRANQVEVTSTGLVYTCKILLTWPDKAIRVSYLPIQDK